MLVPSRGNMATRYSGSRCTRCVYESMSLYTNKSALVILVGYDEPRACRVHTRAAFGKRTGENVSKISRHWVEPLRDDKKSRWLRGAPRLRPHPRHGEARTHSDHGEPTTSTPRDGLISRGRGGSALTASTATPAKVLAVRHMVGFVVMRNCLRASCTGGAPARHIVLSLYVTHMNCTCTTHV